LAYQPSKEDFVEASEKVKGIVVTGVIGEDVHIIGIRVLEHALSKAGFRVISLGIHASHEEFINAAKETKADAILVSSLAGHARVMASGLKDKCIEAGLKGIRLYIGGMLAVDEPKWEDTQKTFKEMGFDRIYPPSTLPGRVIADLEADLLMGNKGMADR
jgi:methylaspartate mutase sigma subunit